MKINIFGYTIVITKNKKNIYPVKTYTSIDFEDYVNDYNCSYNKIITSIALNKEVTNRFKNKQNNYHKSEL